MDGRVARRPAKSQRAVGLALTLARGGRRDLKPDREQFPSTEGQQEHDKAYRQRFRAVGSCTAWPKLRRSARLSSIVRGRGSAWVEGTERTDLVIVASLGGPPDSDADRVLFIAVIAVAALLAPPHLAGRVRPFRLLVLS
jgi:hypothetical protein